MFKQFRLSLLFMCCIGCGVLPVRTPLFDSTTMELDLDSSVDALTGSLISQGILPPESSGLPDVWPSDLPSLSISVPFNSGVVAINLDDIEIVSKFSELIRRVEINELTFRLEENSLNIPVPDFTLQGSDSDTADSENRSLWQTLGSFTGAGPSELTDLNLEFDKGGESFISTQFLDEAKRFGLQSRSQFVYNTEVDNRRPGGRATLRIILGATVFVDTDKLGTIKDLINELK